MVAIKNKIPVGILGATGMVGQRFITLLKDHPWFQVVGLAASSRSAGKSYKDAVQGKWRMQEDIPASISEIQVRSVDDISWFKNNVAMVFSAVDMQKDELIKLEEDYAKAEIPVVSNNSAHRWTKDVPMLIPEINPEHMQLIEVQRKRLGTKKGFIAVKPNCSIQAYVPALAAWKEFEPYELVVSTYQAISGAGKTFADWPQMVENIIPYISGEEEKSEREPLRILGEFDSQKGEISLREGLKITCQCIRVPVLNGHTATVFVKFRKPVTKEELIRALNEFSGMPQEAELPSAPARFIKYMNDDDRPQVKLDVEYENGMGITIGRLREDTVYDYKFVGLAHNTLRGAAGGALLCAEALVEKGYIY